MTFHGSYQPLNRYRRYVLPLLLWSLFSGALLFAAHLESDRRGQFRMDSFRDDVAELARISEVIIADKLHDYDNSLLVLREAYLSDLKQFKETVRLLRNGPLQDRELIVVVVDRNGDLAYTDTPDNRPRLDLHERAYFRYFAEGGADRLYIDEPSFGRVTKRYSLPLVRPMYDKQGGFLGVVALSVKQESLAFFAPRLKLSGNTTATITNHNSAVVSRTRDIEKVQGSKVSPELLAPMLKDEEGVFLSSATFDGSEQLIAYHHIRELDTPLIVFVEVSPREVLRFITMQRTLLMTAAGIISLVFLALILVNLQRRKIKEQFIATQQTHLQQAQRIAGMGSWELELITLEFKWSEEMYLLLGVSRQTFKPNLANFLSCLPEQDRICVSGAIKQAFVEGQLSKEHNVIRGDGQLRTMLQHAKALRDPEGKIVTLVGVMQDITELRQSQEEAIASRKLLQDIIDNSTSLIYALDREGRFLLVNRSLESLFSAAREDILGKTREAIMPGQSVEEHMANDRKVIDHGRPIIIEERNSEADGMHTYLSVKFPIVDFRGDVYGVGGISTDITERKRTEEELSSVTQRLKLAAQAAKLGIWDWDLVNNIMVWDDRMLELCGLTRETFSGGVEAWQNGLYPEDRDKTIAECESALRGEKEWDTDFRVMHPDGTIRQIKANGIVVRDPEGKPVRMLGINFDITEHRQLESQLRQSQKMESVGTLAGGVAHDFNNILSAIIGYGHLTLMKMANEDTNRLNVEHILEAAEKAAHLTKDLLLFSRKQAIDRKPLDLNATIERLQKFLTRVIGEDVICNTRLSDVKLMISADSHQLEQVLMNLATNARDAMPKGGTFTITTEEIVLGEEFTSSRGLSMPGMYALISISDTGHGMDRETRQKIFEPFFTTKEVGKGTGLGLAVVYGIIKQHEGYINVYSEKGTGTTFRIYLPLMASAQAEAMAAIAQEQPIVGGTETILMAEDEEALRKLNHSILKQYGYTVINAVDGVDAVNKFRENKDSIRLLLLDLIMPRMNGSEAYDEIRKINPGIKVIFASGYSPDIVRQKVLLDEEAQLIYKPISPFDLLRKVRATLDNAGT